MDSAVEVTAGLVGADGVRKFDTLPYAVFEISSVHLSLLMSISNAAAAPQPFIKRYP